MDQSPSEIINLNNDRAKRATGFRRGAVPDTEVLVNKIFFLSLLFLSFFLFFDVGTDFLLFLLFFYLSFSDVEMFWKSRYSGEEFGSRVKSREKIVMIGHLGSSL